jgi:hypothetical protein
VLLPFAGAFTEADEPESPPVPEVVPIESLSHDAIEAAEAEIEAEEGEWPATA